MAKIDALNENADAVDTALHEIETGKKELLKGAPAKETPADADGLILVDARNQKTGKLLWSQVKAVLKGWMDTLYAAAGHSHGWSAIIGQLSALTARSQSQGWRQRCADGGRYGGAAWFVGSCLGSVPIVATNDQTPTFTQADSWGNLVNGGEKSWICCSASS